MKLTEANPMNAASSRSLALTIAPAEKPEGRVALVNSGYWGINVQAGTSYGLNFYLRPGLPRASHGVAGERRTARCSRSHDFGAIEAGRVVAAASPPRSQAAGTDPKARFVLSFRGQGDVAGGLGVALPADLQGPAQRPAARPGQATWRT